jgi:hypothetical protein
MGELRGLGASVEFFVVYLHHFVVRFSWRGFPGVPLPRLLTFTPPACQQVGCGLSGAETSQDREWGLMGAINDAAFAGFGLKTCSVVVEERDDGLPELVNAGLVHGGADSVGVDEDVPTEAIAIATMDPNGPLTPFANGRIGKGNR